MNNQSKMWIIIASAEGRCADHDRRNTIAPVGIGLKTVLICNIDITSIKWPVCLQITQI